MTEGSRKGDLKITVYLDCDSLNVYYVINCSKYSLENVWKTSQKMTEIFIWNNACFTNPGKYCFCQILSNHSKF